MNSNLSNVYAFMLKNYGSNYKITYGTPASYLLNITGTESAIKIIYMHEENRFKVKTPVSPSKLIIKSEQADLDVTGSPMQDDCLVDGITDTSLNTNLNSQNVWQFEEEFHKGMSAEKARTIICNEEFQKFVKESAQGSVWLLCNCMDNEKTLFMQYEFLVDNFSRGVVTFMGAIPIHNVNTQTLLREHYTLIRANSRIVTTIENTYCIKADVEVRCSWTTAANLPALIDLNACDVVLKQVFRLKDCSALTKDLMNQLRILVFIRDDILAYKGADNAEVGKEAVYRCGRGIDMEELRESVTKILTEVAGFAEIQSNKKKEYDIEAVLVRGKNRTLTDLTDKLWDILKCCSSYKDLKLAFSILFQCAARCNIVNTPTNKNRLAVIITEVANRRLATPCLMGTEPLELLLEIGLEKLYKDYEFIYTESKICSANTLKENSVLLDNNDALSNVRKSLLNAAKSEAVPIARKTLLHSNVKSANSLDTEDLVGFKNSKFDETETNAQLAKLLQVHCILEHLLMVHVNLHLANLYSDICNQLLKKPLRFVHSIDESLMDKIEIPLSAHNVREQLEDKEPFMRRITMVSRNKFREAQSTYFYCMVNICPPSVAENFKTEDKEFVKDKMYYSWLYRKIKTIK